MIPLAIGQHVHLARRWSQETEGTVTKIGRRWVTITTPNGREVRYDRWDQTEEHHVGAASKFRTDEQYAALLQEHENRRTLELHGFYFDTRAKTEDIAAVAQLLRERGAA